MNLNKSEIDKKFIERGFTDIIKINFNDELINLQKLIYDQTKNYLVNHSENLSIEEKINLKFKAKPSDALWSQLMKVVNESKELNRVINSNSVKDAFRIVLNDPKPFKICTFRARLPEQKRVLYNWHQDEGTWYLSKNHETVDKLPVTLWLSLNGASKEDSIQLVKYTHKKKLLNHQYVTGQGFFNIKKKNFINEKDIFTVETKISECIIFHPLTIHKSVPAENLNLRPRYTIDIRYYDSDLKMPIKVDLVFKIRKILGRFFNHV